MSNAKRRVVVTGIGVVCAIGNDVKTFWDNAMQGVNGVQRIDRFDVSDLSVQIGALVKDFDPTSIMDKRTVRKTDPFVHYGVCAADEALKDSGLDLAAEDPYRIGVIMGSGIGGIIEIQDGSHTLFDRGPSRVSPFFIPKLMPNAASAHIAIQNGIKGPNFTTASACAAANHAVGTALRHIQYGDADVMVTGGSEAGVSRLGMSGFCSAKAMAANRNDDPEHASRPFDADRSGFIMGEGGGVLILEELGHAKARGAKIYCELAGYGATDDAFHITAPAESGEGATQSMLAAMRDAGMNPEDVSYVNAHGTSTPLNDKMESRAVRTALGAHADNITMSSTKSMVGHLLGGSGGVELVACAKSIELNQVHPTRNYTTPDPECDLDYVPNEGRDFDVKGILKNSFGFGGHNASLALRRFEG